MAVTNEPDSPLAAAAEHVLPLRAGEERAVAATKTYTAQLMAVAMLSAALAEDERRWAELRALPGQVADAIDRDAAAAAAAARFRDDDRPRRPRPRLQPLHRFRDRAQGEGDDRRHGPARTPPPTSSTGPMAILCAGLPVLLAAPGPRAFEDLDAVVGLARERTPRSSRISERPEILARGRGRPAPPRGRSRVALAHRGRRARASSSLQALAPPAAWTPTPPRPPEGDPHAMTAPDLLLAVDGGGTRTLAVVADLQGTVLGRGLGPAATCTPWVSCSSPRR